MKIKSIAALCKKNKHIVLFEKLDHDGELIQYIGDGVAVYPLADMPPLDKESALTIFDVPEKQRADWLVETVASAPREIIFDDFVDGERPVEPENIGVAIRGKVLVPIITSRGLVLIDNRYLAPISDARDVLELYERFTTSGTPYIVAKAGLLLQAVIAPVDVISSDFTSQLQKLAKQCELSLTLREQEAEERRVRETETQTTFDENEDISFDNKTEVKELKYHTCSYCGASLDHGEKCDCTESRQAWQAISCSAGKNDKTENAKRGEIL